MYVERKEPMYRMEVTSIRPPTIATGFIMFFAIVSFLTPFVVIGIILSSGHGFKFGLLISTAVFFAVGYYLFRVASWNYNGKEVIEIFEDEVVYRAHTKLLTLSTHKIELKGCILIRLEEAEGMETYLLRNNEQVVEMRFPADSKKLNQFEKALNERNE